MDFLLGHSFIAVCPSVLRVCVCVWRQKQAAFVITLRWYGKKHGTYISLSLSLSLSLHLSTVLHVCVGLRCWMVRNAGLRLAWTHRWMDGVGCCFVACCVVIYIYIYKKGGMTSLLCVVGK